MLIFFLLLSILHLLQSSISNCTIVLFSANCVNDVGARAQSFLGRINLKKCRTAKQPPIFLQLSRQSQPTPPHQPPPALAPMVQSNLASASPILTLMLSEPTTKQKQAYSGMYFDSDVMHDLKTKFAYVLFLLLTRLYFTSFIILNIGGGKGCMPFLKWRAGVYINQKGTYYVVCKYVQCTYISRIFSRIY